MARPALALGLLAVVVVSGCLTANPAGSTPVEPTASAPPYADRDAPSRNGYENPWRADEITVVVDDYAGMDRNIAPEVQATLQYWEHHAGDTAAYEPDYRLRSQADDPEIRVEIVPVVSGCGVHEDSVALGCAPVLRGNETGVGTVTVQVRAGHSRGTMRSILKHEFGHTLGYRHGEGPRDVMAGNLTARSLTDVIDAEQRKYPWGDDELSVAVTGEQRLTDAQRERIRSALEYYERGADGTVPRPPSFELVEDSSEADVVVSLQSRIRSCEIVGPDASCASWDGPSVDADPAPEYYTDVRIAVAAAGHDRPGWHVGYWLGYSLWTNGLPKPFQTGVAGDEKPAATTW
ncbi:MAG: hypothetical protein ABEJ90_02640 [Halobacterium sp.]